MHLAILANRFSFEEQEAPEDGEEDGEEEGEEDSWVGGGLEWSSELESFPG